MKIVRDDALIKRNGTVGRWTSLTALIVLALGMYLTLQQKPEFVNWSIAALVVGFILTQVGMYFSNRWGRSPRPDELIDSALKGLPNEIAVYHYKTPAPHLVVGPMGVYILIPYKQRGILAFSQGRWRLSKGGFLQGYMSIFGQEGLGRPELEAARQVEAVKRYMGRRLESSELPEINPILVFTSELLRIETPEGTPPAIAAKKLKDFFRQKLKSQAPLEVTAIISALPSA